MFCLGTVVELLYDWDGCEELGAVAGLQELWLKRRVQNEPSGI
jgi:hypothetical protein